jgi:hypothetical protein
VQWFEEIDHVYELCIYGVRRGLGRTLGGGFGASFVADVTRARESPGDSGIRVGLLLPISRSGVTSLPRTDCNVDEWGEGVKRGVTWGLSWNNGFPTARIVHGVWQTLFRLQVMCTGDTVEHKTEIIH